MILKNGKRIDGCSDTVPIGTVNPFLGTVAPFGYLLLQGQKESKTTYPELYAICGTTFGPETDTEFTLPDLRGQTIAGYKEGDSVFGTLGGLIGEISHTLTAAESGLPTHKHRIYSADVMVWAGSHGITGNKGFSSGTDSVGTLGAPSTMIYTESVTSQDASVSHNNIQPTIVLNWIVKAFNLMPNTSTVVTAKNNSDSNVYSTNYINDLFETMKRESFDFAHPVGSYYETSDSSWTPQAAGWYGTWVADNDGSALVSYKSSGAFNKVAGTIVGGESQSYTPVGTNTGGSVGNHTLTAAESGLPTHQHVYTSGRWYYSERDGGGDIICNQSGTSYAFGRATDASGGTSASAGHNHGFTQPTFSGTAATLSTIQTSKVVYRWHRTA